MFSFATFPYESNLDSQWKDKAFVSTWKNFSRTKRKERKKEREKERKNTKQKG